MKDNSNVQTIEEMFSRISMDDDAIKYIEKMCDDIKNVKGNANSKNWKW